MRVHPLLCLLAITGFILIFYYFTFRNKITNEYKVSNLKTNSDSFVTSKKIDDPKNNNPEWQITETEINYAQDDQILKTLNDKIINSEKFNYFLYKFLDKSQSAKYNILSQSKIYTKDFNSTIFLSTLFYTKYDEGKDGKHKIITKGKSKKNALILKIAIEKAIAEFYQNAENSILAIDDMNLLLNKINIFENKANELVSRISKSAENSASNFASISINAEINILEKELAILQENYAKIVSGEMKDTFEQSMKNKYLREFGRINEYCRLINQLNDVLNEKENAPNIIEEILHNKSKLSVLLKNEFSRCITHLANEISRTKSDIISLKKKPLILSSEKLLGNEKNADLKLLEKINNSLNSMKDEYYKTLSFWTKYKSSISFESGTL